MKDKAAAPTRKAEADRNIEAVPASLRFEAWRAHCRQLRRKSGGHKRWAESGQRGFQDYLRWAGEGRREIRRQRRVAAVLLPASLIGAISTRRAIQRRRRD
jgi:hypothetical protein